MPKTISFGLSKSEIDRAIKELRAYESDLKRKIGLFVDKLAKMGVQVTQAVMSEVPQEDEAGTWNVRINSDQNGMNASATIMLEGDKILFIEFGAGLRYANPQNPLAKKMGYGPGTYPGQTHIPEPGYWYYTDEVTGESKKSYGNRAYMPMYHTSEAIRLMIQSVAKEVFGE